MVVLYEVVFYRVFFHQLAFHQGVLSSAGLSPGCSFISWPFTGVLFGVVFFKVVFHQGGLSSASLSSAGLSPGCFSGCFSVRWSFTRVVFHQLALAQVVHSFNESGCLLCDQIVRAARALVLPASQSGHHEDLRQDGRRLAPRAGQVSLRANQCQGRGCRGQRQRRR